MSRQRLSIDVATHVRLGAPLLLMPPVAALIYPFLLEGFHASITPVIRGRTAEPATAVSSRRRVYWPSQRRLGRSSERWRSARSLCSLSLDAVPAPLP